MQSSVGTSSCSFRFESRASSPSERWARGAADKGRTGATESSMCDPCLDTGLQGCTVTIETKTDNVSVHNTASHLCLFFFAMRLTPQEIFF
jgi:hypothetical protein